MLSLSLPVIHNTTFYPCYGLAEVTVDASGSFIAEEPIIFDADEVLLKQNDAAESSQGDSGVKHLVGSGHV